MGWLDCVFVLASMILEVLIPRTEWSGLRVEGCGVTSLRLKVTRHLRLGRTGERLKIAHAMCICFSLVIGEK